MEQRAKDSYNLVDCFLVSRAGMSFKNDDTCLGSALCEMTSSVWIQERRVQGRGMPSVTVRSAKEAQRLRAKAEGGKRK